MPLPRLALYPCVLLAKKRGVWYIRTRMITDGEALKAWAVRANAQPSGRVVLDLEADSLHCYRERLCLIQYADEQGEEIIDPLAIKEMQPFKNWLPGAQVWMHGADYDMELLLKTFGSLPSLILDTQVAAQLLGYEQFGLTALVEQFYGIVLSKKNQKANWAIRPIPAEMQEYAQGDVAYMLKLADRLVRQLREKKRYEWFLESCRYNMKRARQRHRDKQRWEDWRIKGCGKLERRGLAALRALYNWRSAEAERLDCPPFHVCHNEALLRWSVQLESFGTAMPLSYWSGPRCARFRRAVRNFQLLDEEEYPIIRKSSSIHYANYNETQLEHWMQRRDALAQDLGIEPSLLATRGQLECLAAGARKAADLMNWQRNLLLGETPLPRHAR